VIEESNQTIRELSKLDANLEQPDGSTYRGAFTELLKQLNTGTHLSVEEASTVSKISVTIHVDRTTRFFVFNYVLLITTLYVAPPAYGCAVEAPCRAPFRARCALCALLLVPAYSVT
jgi:hypothetical protein